MVGNVYELLDMQKDKNVPIQSRKNCVTVLGCDPALSGKIKFNTLSNRKNVEGALPWNKSEDLREWTNIDSEYLIYYMETYYLLNSDKKILSALEMVADTNKFNPFIDMLNSISWDGTPRIANLLTDYLGVEKNDYSAHSMELLMLAAISRAFNPGTKFDYVLILSGKQGIDEGALLYEFKQAWAEAYKIYLSGKFSLVMPKRLQGYVEKLQEDFKEDDPLIGMIQYWLDTHNHEYVCNKQIAAEVFNVDNPDRRLLNQITEIMNNSIEGWERSGTHRFPVLGKQKCYKKTQDFTEAYQEELPFT